MELPTIATKVPEPPSAKDQEFDSKGLASPEPEPRGRKRRRSPMPFSLVRPSQTLSGDSSTLRGRCRRRSTSLVNMSSRNTSRSLRDASQSPSKKRLLRVFQRQRHRSQSPSRSRSPGGMAGNVSAKRRRQRTQSRSRDHDHDTSFVSATRQGQTLPLRLEMTTLDQADTRNQDRR